MSSSSSNILPEKAHPASAIMNHLAAAGNDNLEDVVSTVVGLCYEMRKSGGRLDAMLCCGQDLALKNVTRARSQFSHIESAVEKKQAMQLRLCDMGIEDYFFCADYEHLIGTEIGLLQQALAARALDINDMASVFLGSGALPVSPLMIARKSGRPVQCVDMDIQANDMARGLLSKIDPEGALSITDSTAEDFDYSGADIVYMASLIAPKRDVLAQIAKYKTRFVMIRTVDDSFDMIYEPFDQEMIESLGFRKCSQTALCNECMHQTILLENKAFV